MKHSISFSLRISLELLEKIEKAVQEKKFASVSEAMKYYIELGILVESYKTTIKDADFVRTIGQLKQNDSIFQWLETLTDEQTDAIAYALNMEKEKRNAHRNLR